MAGLQVNAGAMNNNGNETVNGVLIRPLKKVAMRVREHL